MQYDDKVKKIFRSNYAELSRLVSVSTNRSSIATELYSAHLISETCFDEVQDNSNKTDIDKGSSLMRAIKSSIHSKPNLFETFIAVLESVEAFKEIAEKLNDDFYSIESSRYMPQHSHAFGKSEGIPSEHCTYTSVDSPGGTL